VRRKEKPKEKPKDEAKGKAEGEAKEKREIAKNLLKAKVDLQLIATATGLTLEELKKIKIK
jgi:predicted transposase/invertase (TIGR01784 family)